MDDATAEALRELVRRQPIGALGTLHETREGDEPFVSMTPVAWLPGAVAVIHVSSLAPHTRDLQRAPRASLMLTAPLRARANPQALPRLTVQADAEVLAPSHPEAAAARDAYLARYPRAVQTFALGDFMLVALRPRTARFVAGFGKAHALGGEALAALLVRT